MNNSVMKSIPQIIRDNVCTMFNLLNLTIAVLLAAVGAWKNTLFILAVAANTIIGTIQEIKAKRQIEKLTLLSLPAVTVIRGGEEENISPEEIKKGDILSLESGSVVCCDCKIISGFAEMNESILTGEAEPVSKSCGDELLSGSSVISGKCLAEAVCEIGDSFAAKITDEVKNTAQSGSEMLQSMKKVTKFTGFFIVPIGVLMFAQAIFLRNVSVSEAVVSTSAGLLGMLPKGLVLLISIGFAAGVIKLSKKQVLVRELYCLENLAHCDTVCLDKTGTLTEGELSVEKTIPYIAADEFEKLMAAYVKHTPDNNSTFAALKKHFKKNDTFGCISSVPFSSDRKYSSVTLDNGKTLVIGAPEKLAESVPCEALGAMAEGKRVIFAGLCSGEVCPENTEPIGIIVISDKLRKTARETIKYFYSQGIDVKVISGDNPLAAAAAARAAGIKNTEMYIDMSGAEDEEIKNIAEKYTVFGRTSPMQKKLLIEAMQKTGHKVAMTGDGVNDLPAMRRADCSAAVGAGCDAAKQTAQIVLLNSDFSVLKDVISEGRRVVNNLTKSAGVFFIKTIYSVLLCLLCLLFNTEFPFIPIQITLIDAVIEGFPAFFMSFEKNDKKCSESFLRTALKNALPNGIAVFVCCGVIALMSGCLKTDSAHSALLMYLSVGLISVAGLIKASVPFNPLRFFLTSSSAFGFILAVALFSDLLQLPHLPAGEAIMFAVLSGILIAFNMPGLKRNSGRM